MKVLEEKYKDVLQLKDLKKDVQRLKNELVWAYVRDKKRVSWRNLDQLF